MENNPEHPEIDEQDEEHDDAIVGTALKWSGVVVLALALGVVLYLLSQKQEKKEKDIVRDQITAPEKLSFKSGERPQVAFRSYESGINFVHENGAVGEKLLPETMGGGVAVFDYDQDGVCARSFSDSMRLPISSSRSDTAC